MLITPNGFLGDSSISEEILPGIRLYGDAVGFAAIFLEIFESIKNSPSGSALFETPYMLAAGLDVYLTSSSVDGSQGRSYGIRLSPGPGPLLGIYLQNTYETSEHRASFIDQHGNVVTYDLKRLVLHEFIHAATGLTDAPGADPATLFPEYDKVDCWQLRKERWQNRGPSLAKWFGNRIASDT